MNLSSSRNSVSVSGLTIGRKRSHSVTEDDDDELLIADEGRAAEKRMPNGKVGISYGVGGEVFTKLSPPPSMISVEKLARKDDQKEDRTTPPFLRSLLSTDDEKKRNGFYFGWTKLFDISSRYPATSLHVSSDAPSKRYTSDVLLLKKRDTDMVKNNEDFFPDDAKEGLLNVRAATLLLLWYFFSFCTLFLNKYILSFLQGEPTLLGAVQMVSTTCFGFVQMYIPCGLYRRVERKGLPKGFWRNMALVGSMRFSTVVLGLFALKYISVSFTETVKSTAPLFTVIIAWLILGERCGLYVLASLLPVMGGLALCSAYELNFHLIGFAAAVGTNLMDCLQNVFSKLLISGEDHKYTPAELQFYTSVASVVVQIPASFFVMDFEHAQQDLSSGHMFAALLTNGLCFHLQSITAYALMGYISPVTHSVANTAKRAILIWLSVMVFGNEVTFMSAAGTAIVLLGVLGYNKARDYELQRNRWKQELIFNSQQKQHHRIV